MLPETQSVDPQDVSDRLLHNYCREKRKVALDEVIKSLDINFDDVETIDLDPHPQGNVIVTYTKNWHVIINSDIRSSTIGDKFYSQLAIHAMITLNRN